MTFDLWQELLISIKVNYSVFKSQKEYFLHKRNGSSQFTIAS